jgi:hypothetical protein
LQQLRRDDTNLVDGILESVLCSRGWMLNAGDFADELSGGLLDFVGSRADSGWLS